MSTETRIMVLERALRWLLMASRNGPIPEYLRAYNHGCAVLGIDEAAAEAKERE